MQTVVARPSPEVRTAPLTWRDSLHAPERLSILFFLWMAAFGLARRISLQDCAILLALPACLLMLWRIESLNSRVWSRVVRDWTILGLILPAYWSLEWFAAPPRHDLQNLWIGWDQWLLITVGLQKAIESLGGAIPAVLETVYFLLYAIPTTALGVAYALGDRRHTQRFTLVLLAGTLTAYALIPVWPVASPRQIFPDHAPPHYAGIARQTNTWILDHLDISTGVFPSGHCAVAFSAAFGLLSAFRRRWAVWLPFFGIAFLVYLATVYGRYHYAVDGAASFFIAAAAWLAVEAGARR